MSRRPDLPDEAPEQPAGGSISSQDPNTRIAPGHEGRTSWEDEGSILGRIKHPVSSRGRVTPKSEGTGGGEPGEVADNGEPLREGSYQPTDSRIGLEGYREGGTSYLGSGGIADVEIQRPAPEEIDRQIERRAELFVAGCFTLAALAALAFVVMNFAGNIHKQYYTPTLGILLGVALVSLGAGAVHWAKRLMPHEEAVQEREPHFSPKPEFVATEETIERSIHETGLGRRPIIRRTLLMAGGALGLVGLVPVLNLGKLVGRYPYDYARTSWRRGLRMIDSDGRPIKLGDVAIGGLLTVFPALGDATPPPSDAGPDARPKYPKPETQVKGDSTVILIRLRPGELTGKNAQNAYFDHIAYSKICTHAGCPVSLYEQQTHHLLCPCHQSMFDVVDGGRPIFGPAARALPQLAIEVDSEGYFVAKGDFGEPIGPSYWERT